MTLDDYPFGLKHKGYNSTISSNGNSTARKFGYNGKEYQEDLGLDWLDYGWRNYDPSIARFNKIDRFAEKYENHTSAPASL
jgi:RHS repeat-associated protein